MIFVVKVVCGNLVYAA
ncbi:DUF3265 domain-containing protein, partial [Vibrio vulnificus]|nr:DUF3265 domain-containing protein [Vibrio vulnificus]